MPLFANGGNNDNAIHPAAQGRGGHGRITLYIAENEKITAYWLREYCPVNNSNQKNDQLLTIQQLIIEFLQPCYYRLIIPPVRVKDDLSGSIPDDVTMKTSYYNAKGRAHTKQAQYVQALACYQKSLELLEKRDAHKDSNIPKSEATSYSMLLADTYKDKGITLTEQGNFEEALKAHEKELAFIQQLYKDKPNHSRIIEIKTRTSLNYHYQGNDKKATEILDAILSPWENDNLNKAGPHNVWDNEEIDWIKNLATTYDARGLVHCSQGDYKNSMKDHQEAFKKRKKMHKNTKDHIDFVLSHKHIGRGHHDTGEYIKAIASYNNGLKVLQKLYPAQPDHPDIAAIKSLLGKVYHSQGEYKQAIDCQEEALNIILKRYHKNQPNHPDIASILSLLALSHNEQGDYDLAAYYYQKGIEMLQVVYKHKDLFDGLFTYLAQQKNIK